MSDLVLRINDRDYHFTVRDEDRFISPRITFNANGVPTLIRIGDEYLYLDSVESIQKKEPEEKEMHAEILWDNEEDSDGWCDPCDEEDEDEWEEGDEWDEKVHAQWQNESVQYSAPIPLSGFYTPPCFSEDLGVYVISYQGNIHYVHPDQYDSWLVEQKQQPKGEQPMPLLTPPT